MSVIKERRRHGGRNSGGKIKKAFGVKGATYVPMGIGYLFGFAGDMLYNSLGLPGYDQPSGNCNAFSWGDVIQLASLTGLTFFGFMTKNWMFPSFFFGAMAGSLTPKLLAASRFPRYIIFNIDQKSGAIAPTVPGGVRGAYKPLGEIGAGVQKAVGGVQKKIGQNIPFAEVVKK